MIIEIKGGVDIESCQHAQEQRGISRKKFFDNHQYIPCIVCASRLVSFKGIDTTISAVREVHKLRSIALFIIGDGPLETALRELAEKFLPNRYKFLMALSPEETLSVIAASDLLCCLSRNERRYVPGGSYIHTETMGRSVYEAIACGIPVVTSNVGGLPEVCKPPLGVVVPADHVDEAAIAINAQLTAYCSDSSIRDFRANFSYERIFNTYMELWSV